MPNTPAVMSEVDLWWQIVRLTRTYARRKYGQDVARWTLHLSDGQESVEPFPPPFMEGPPSGEAS